MFDTVQKSLFKTGIVQNKILQGLVWVNPRHD